MPPPSGYRYSINCFQVGPRSSRIVMEDDSGIIPQTRENFRVFNIGRVPIYAEAKYGTAFQWLGGIGSATIEPGEDKLLDTGVRPYYVTGIYLRNDADSRALVHCGLPHNRYSTIHETEPNWTLKIDINNLAKKLVVFGVGNIPFGGKGVQNAGAVLSTLINFFWPETHVSVWDQINDQVTNLVDTKTNEAIRGILGGDIRYFKERISTLKKDLENHINCAEHFMNIAEDLIGFEKKFYLRKEDNSNAGEINFFILPLYSTFVTLKLVFYYFGILHHEEIKLTPDEVKRLKDYATRMIEGPDGAVNYIESILKERVENELNTCNPDHVFDAVATIRTFCGLNGIEYFAFWRGILENPTSTKKPYNDAITFSTLFGRPTPFQARQMVPEEVEQPLQPKLINGKRNKIGGIDVWMWRIDKGYGSPKIGGMKIRFENGDSYSMGTRSREIHSVDFKGALCTRLSVWGDGALDCLEFAFSDGRVESYGTRKDAGNEYKDFALEGHHIAGVYLGNDIDGLAGQATNITVSYQLTTEDDK